MNFGGIQRCSTIDFPGYLSCVLFTRGCDMNCFYCHNRALLHSGGPVVPEEEVLAFLQKRRGLLEGVVVSGGEPALQPDLSDWLRKIREMGYHTKLDTNGQHPDAVRRLLDGDLLDYVAVDYKALPRDYAWVSGTARGDENAKQTIRLLLRAGLAFEARTTLYPGLSEAALLELLHGIEPLPRYRLNLFRMPEQSLPKHALLLRRSALNAAQLDNIAPQLRAAQPHIVW